MQAVVKRRTGETRGCIEHTDEGTQGQGCAITKYGGQMGWRWLLRPTLRRAASGRRQISLASGQTYICLRRV